MAGCNKFRRQVKRFAGSALLCENPAGKTWGGTQSTEWKDGGPSQTQMGKGSEIEGETEIGTGFRVTDEVVMGRCL